VKWSIYEITGTKTNVTKTPSKAEACRDGRGNSYDGM
jgi:hypothetical protein